MSRRASPRETPNELALMLRLARVVAAMAQDTAFHDQMFEIVADLEALQLERQARLRTLPQQLERGVRTTVRSVIANKSPGD